MDRSGGGEFVAYDKMSAETLAAITALPGSVREWGEVT